MTAGDLDFTAVTEPVTTARAVLHAALEGRAAALRAAHDDGATWAQIGAALGVSEPRAEAISLSAEDRRARRTTAADR